MLQRLGVTGAVGGPRMAPDQPPTGPTVPSSHPPSINMHCFGFLRSARCYVYILMVRLGPPRVMGYFLSDPSLIIALLVVNFAQIVGFVNVVK